MHAYTPEPTAIVVFQTSLAKAMKAFEAAAYDLEDALYKLRQTRHYKDADVVAFVINQHIDVFGAKQAINKYMQNYVIPPIPETYI